MGTRGAPGPRPEPKSRRPRILSQVEMQKIVDDFNLKYPVGTHVYLKKDFGNEVLTSVTHAAYILSGHSPVAFFKGISGCYAIDGRVRPA